MIAIHLNVRLYLAYCFPRADRVVRSRKVRFAVMELCHLAQRCIDRWL